MSAGLGLSLLSRAPGTPQFGRDRRKLSIQDLTPSGRVPPTASPTVASVFLLTALAMPAAGQLAAPNAAGVSLGHIHLYVSDVAAQQKFWATMGGVPVANQRLEMIQFPGVFILLRRGETKGGTVGSIVNHIGFVWKDLPAAKAKWQAAGYKIEN